MRHAKKLGFLGVVVALVAAFGLVLGGGAEQAHAQIPLTTVQPCTIQAGGTATCTFSTTTTVVAGGTLVLTTSAPFTIQSVASAGGGVFGTCQVTPLGGQTGIGTTTVTIGPCPPGTSIPAGLALTINFGGVTSTTTTIPLTVTYNANTPTTTGTTVMGTCGTSTSLTVAVSCVNAPTVTTTGAGSTVTFAITVPAGTATVAAPPATAGTCPLSGIAGNGTAAVTLTYTCGAGQSFAAGTTLTIPVLGVTVGTTPTETTTAAGGVVLPTTQTISFTVAPTPVPPAASNQPTSEVKYCNNTATNGALSQTLGGVTQTLGITGPATTFTLPLFGPASTCILQPQRVVGGTVTNCGTGAGLAACSDGYLVVTLTTGSGAFLSCSAGFTGTAPVPVATNNGGQCTSQVEGTQLNLPCGVTAGTSAASTTASSTCTNVLFDISSALGACVNTPTFCASQEGLGLGLGGVNGLGGIPTQTATVTVQFVATPANGGSVGGIQLGTNTFSFAGPGIGTLLVAASPQLIPSNGTEASVVSATFACTTGFNSVGGFPLSSTATSLPLTIGPNGQLVVSGTSSCGAGLPGTFTFATPAYGVVLFDNGRTTESISCGPNANVNAFGNGAPFFGATGTTFPLVFTCTGAAVLAIGAGSAGDAPINVTYVSAVGGLQAVGSTLLTVSPSGIPRISVACNPSSISAGNTGSLCTATVTDINGTPLTGITGATVTFTTSDPADTSILPCTIGTPGAINVTTSPAVIPLVTPQTPCVTPSGTIPGQVNTFINGQATALLVASPTAHPEVVTVTASLGVLIPPEFACLVSPYVSSGFGTTPAQPGYYAPVNGTGIYGCGSTTPIGTTGLATALSAVSGGLTGIVTLPNTTSASTTVTVGGPAGIQVAGATAISPIVLSRGCNNVIITSPVGTPVANIAALVSPQNAVVSIWRFSNSTKLFQAGFFSDPNAPTDFTLTGSLSTTTAPNAASTVISGATYSPVTGTLSNVPSVAGTQITESYYVCVNQQATMISG